MTIPDWLWHWVWHGIRGAVLAGGSAATATVQTTGAWPSKVEWLIIIVAAILGFVNGADSYSTSPQ